MNEPYSILFQKSSDAFAYDSYANWNCVCTSFPLTLDAATKELASRDWPGEDGEDVFIPKTLPLKPYDFEVSMVYRGDDSVSFLESFRDYLIGGELKIYNSFVDFGRRGCYLLGMSDFKYYQGSYEDVVTFKMKFRVTDPKTRVTAVPVTSVGVRKYNLVAV